MSLVPFQLQCVSLFSGNLILFFLWGKYHIAKLYWNQPTANQFAPDNAVLPPDNGSFPY